MRRCTGTKTTSLGTTFLKISDLEKWTKVTRRGHRRLGVCDDDWESVQRATCGALVSDENGVPTLPAAAPLAPARTLRHSASTMDSRRRCIDAPADAVNPATMMAPAAKTRV